MTSSSLRRRLEKLGPELPRFEEWLEQLYSTEKGPLYPRRDGIEEMYLKKFQETMVTIFRQRGDVPPVADPEDDPRS
jgi:hypothetical protein